MLHGARMIRWAMKENETWEEYTRRMDDMRQSEKRYFEEHKDSIEVTNMDSVYNLKGE